MRPRFNFRPLAGILLVAWSMPSFAMRLGTPNTLSYIGEPLILEVPLLDSMPDELKSIIIKSVAYPYAPKFPGHPEYRVELRGSPDTPVLLVTSDLVVNESVLDLAMSINWAAGNMIQPITAVLDTKPPVVQPAIPVINNNDTSIIYSVTTEDPVKVIDNIPPLVLNVQPEQSVKVNTDELLVTSIEQPFVGVASKTEVITPVNSDRYLIQRNDTLYKIASKTKPDNLTVAEWMTAIYKHNKILHSADISTLRELILPSNIASTTIPDPQIINTYKSTPNKKVFTDPVPNESPRALNNISNSKLKFKHAANAQPISKSTDTYQQTDKKLIETEKTIRDLELKVKQLSEKSKSLDREISKFQKENSATKEVPSKNLEKKGAISKPAGVSLQMPLFEDSHKGLLAVISTYSKFKHGSV